jgi:hypothetical protein
MIIRNQARCAKSSLVNGLSRRFLGPPDEDWSGVQRGTIAQVPGD